MVRAWEPCAGVSGSGFTLHPLSDEDHRRRGAQYTAPLSLRGNECDRVADDLNHRMEARVGDKSPKAKERDQKQKNAAKVESAAQARSKQDSQNRAAQIPGKAKK